MDDASLKALLEEAKIALVEFHGAYRQIEHLPEPRTSEEALAMELLERSVCQAAPPLMAIIEQLSSALNVPTGGARPPRTAIN